MSRYLQIAFCDITCRAHLVEYRKLLLIILEWALRKRESTLYMTLAHGIFIEIIVYSRDSRPASTKDTILSLYRRVIGYLARTLRGMITRREARRLSQSKRFIKRCIWKEEKQREVLAARLTFNQSLECRIALRIHFLLLVDTLSATSSRYFLSED